MRNEIKVTVFCLVYNHIDYIKEALEGVLNQKTDFKYNVFIFDDASTDGTSDILRVYQQRHPNKIHLYVSPTNTYGKAERATILQELYGKHVVGEYVACCEGDDAWIDCNKLQMQVDYMDEHPECMMTTHSFKMIDYSSGSEVSRTFGAEDRILSSEEIILQPNGNLGTASLVMRREVFLRDARFPMCDVDDFPMQLYAVCHGNIYYFNREMSIYRFMHDGSWSKKQKEYVEKAFYHSLRFIDFLLEYDVYSNGKYTDLIQKKVVLYWHAVITNLCELENSEHRFHNIDFRNGHKCAVTKSSIEQVYRWMSGTYVISTEERQYLNEFEEIYIMGKGKYSKYIINILARNDIEYQGFLVSKREVNACDEDTWTVAECSCDKSKTLVIVGISQIYESEIVEILKKNNFENIWFPLWFVCV